MKSLNTTNNATSFSVLQLEKGGNYSVSIKQVNHASRIESNSQSAYLAFESMK